MELTFNQALDIYCYHLFLYYEKSHPILSDRDFDLLEQKFKKMFPKFDFNTLIDYFDKEMEFERRFQNHIRDGFIKKYNY